MAHIFEDEKARESYKVTALDDDSVDALLRSDNEGAAKKDRKDESAIHLSKHAICQQGMIGVS